MPNQSRTKMQKEKKTKILLEEAQQEYDSQSAYHLCYLHFFQININTFNHLTSYNVSFSFPFPDLSPGETLHDLVAQAQHDLAKLKPIEKLGRDYL